MRRKRRMVSFCLAWMVLAMTLCAASCGNAAENAVPPETEYPKLSERRYNADGELVSDEVRVYDPDGHLTAITCHIYRMQDMGLSGMTSEGGCEYEATYEYENGALQQFAAHEKYLPSGEGKDTVLDYRYDTDGLPEEISESVGGQFRRRSTFRRGGSGRVKQVITYDADGGLESMIEHKYDASGRCVEEKEYNAQSMIRRYLYRYDQSGNITECDAYDKDGGMTVYAFRYDESHRLIGRTWSNSDGKVYRREESSYDSGGRKQRCTVRETDAQGESVTSVTEYDEYDDNGNCIQMSLYNGEHTLLSRYEWEYGSEKVPKMQWEMKNCRFHGSFLQ